MRDEVEDAKNRKERYFSYETQVDCLSKDFKNSIKLNNEDYVFLSMVLAMHYVRVKLQGKLDFNFEKVPSKDRLKGDERKKSGENQGKKSGKYHEEEEINKILKGTKDNKLEKRKQEYLDRKNVSDQERYLTWYEILLRPVPYDAMHAKPGTYPIGVGNINLPGVELNGRNHHVATLGHDPALGFIFGTMNIMTRTITYKNFRSFYVLSTEQLDKRSQWVDYSKEYLLTNIIQECIDSTYDDPSRLIAAIARQAIHINSDELTKQGLAFPFLSLINEDKAKKLLNNGWNNNELKRLTKHIVGQLAVVGQQYQLSEFITLIVHYLYMLAYYSDDNKTNRINEVKIQKICTLANYIITETNFISVLLTINPSLMDIGGLISLIKNFVDYNKKYDKLRDEIVYEGNFKCFQTFVETGRYK